MCVKCKQTRRIHYIISFTTCVHSLQTCGEQYHKKSPGRKPDSHTLKLLLPAQEGSMSIQITRTWYPPLPPTTRYTADHPRARRPQYGNRSLYIYRLSLAIREVILSTRPHCTCRRSGDMSG